jgi:hypothetical protein
MMTPHFTKTIVIKPQRQKGGQVPPRDVVPMEEEDIWKKSATLKEIVTNTSSNS